MLTTSLSLLLTLGTFAALDAADEKAAERKKEIETQKKLAVGLWQSVLSEGKKPVMVETASLLLYGTCEEKELEAIGKGMEKGLATARKNAGVKPEADLWPGKAVVHVCKERAEFRAFYIKLTKESPEKDEQGIYAHDRDATTILVSAADMKRHPPEIEGVIQLAAATLTKKAGRLPDWFVMGFSRAHGYRHAPNHFNAERQKTRLLLRQGRTAKDVWTGNLGADEGPALTASLFDFLINSPQMAKLWPEVLSSMGEETPFEDALKGAKLMPERVELAWRVWAGR